MTPTIETFVAGLQLGAPLAHGALTMHPLLAEPGAAPSWLALDDALASGRFRIVEVSESGTVPTLKAVNELERPVLLLDGEELVGAKQNRVLNLTILVPANSELEIPVSCVEAGRWHRASAAFASPDRAQFARGRARRLAQVSLEMHSSGLRSSDQGDVWAEIDAKAERMAARSPTAAMGAIYEKSMAALDEVTRAMPPAAGQVGAVFAIGGRIAGLDAFAADSSWARAAAKLLRSYAVDALEARDGSEPAAPPPDAASVRAFLDRVARAPAASFKALGLGDDLRLGADGLAGAALAAEDRIVHLVAFPAERFADEEGRQAGGFAMRARRPRAG